MTPGDPRFGQCPACGIWLNLRELTDVHEAADGSVCEHMPPDEWFEARVPDRGL